MRARTAAVDPSKLMLRTFVALFGGLALLASFAVADSLSRGGEIRSVHGANLQYAAGPS